MTREEAEAHVRLVGRKCRGPFILGEHLDDWRTQLWHAAEAKDCAALEVLIHSLQLSYHTEYGLGWVEILEQDFNALLKRALHLVLAHADDVNRGICGYDINDIICSHHFDSEKHEAICPKCGVDQTYTAPWYPGVDGF